MAHVRIRPRRSTKAEWEYDNPVLAEGEMGIEVPSTGVGTGLINAKFGDGVRAWNDLPYGIINNAELTQKMENVLFLSETHKEETTPITF